MDFAVGGQNQYLPNGARVYLDAGSHVETATPECVSARQVVVYEKALEKMIAAKAAEFNNHLPGKAKIILFKNNADFKGNGYGCHENYLVPLSLWSELAIASCGYLPSIFQLFLAIRPILCGAGYVTPDARFLFSRRAVFIKCITGSQSQESRPMIHQKTETLSHYGFSRLHLLIADSNMSEFSSYLRMGTTHLMLLALEKLLESGKIPVNHGIFAGNIDALKLLREANDDIACAKRYSAGLFRKVSVCDLHYLLIDFINDILHNSLSPEEKEILALWHECVKKIEEGDEDYLARRLDWAIKKNLMERKLERRDIDPAILTERRVIGAWSDWRELTRLQMIDLLYHDISSGGIYNQLAERGAVETILESSEVERAKTIPPETRAAWRGNTINYFNEKLEFDEPVLRRECWTRIVIADKDKKTEFINNNPYEKDWSEVRRFIDKIAN